MFAASKTASVSGGYQISRSLRFNSADSAYLNRTPASAGNRKTWTWSGWIKRSNISVLQALFGSKQGIAGTPRAGIQIEDTDALTFIYNSTGSANSQITTTAVYRDVSAWYHIVLAVDTTQTTNTNRLKLYINGVQVTTFSTADYPTLNEDLPININTAHMIGSFDPASGTDRYFRGYMTEVNFIDGQALTPSSFGETNAQTGVWQPKAYSGSYGTNGFYLNFSDNSNTTAATLGKDYSGNGNNWTPNNFSVTAGAGNDSLVDSPTSYGTDTGVGGTVRGNYSTLNPLKNVGGTTTLANGNLNLTNTSNSWGTRFSTIGMSTDKWYWECVRTANTYGAAPGIATEQLSNGDGSTTGGISWLNNGQIQNEGSSSIIAPTYTDNDTLRLAYDADAGTLQVAVNGGSFTTVATGKSGRTWFPVLKAYGGSDAILINFGQRPFAYTAPSGYKALCTQNLPTPTIGATTATQAGKYFNPVIWTGNGSTQTISGVGFQPDFTWAKCRSNGATANILQDVIRGAGSTLFSEDTSGQLGNSGDLITSWNSDGFGVNRNFLGGTTNNSTNGSGYTYVAWNWKANGSGSTNTAGSITSTVSANTTSGFSVVTYTGTGANATVGHGLGVAPSMVIVKRRDTTANWEVRHTSIAVANTMRLNLTDAEASATTVWNSTAPSSTLFSIGTSTSVNASSGTYVAYCFAPIAGYSAFGQYTGNGSTDGVFVYTGFRPAYVLIKRTTSAYNWWILDAARGTINAVKGRLYADGADAESTTYPYMDFLSNGFKLRDADGGLNASGEPYIYACFAQNPFKYSLAR